MFLQPRTAAYSAQDQLVWKILFDRQHALLHRRAAPAFSQGLERLGLGRNTIPDLGELSAEIRQLTGWELLAFGQPVSQTLFFELLARRQFPVVTRLRAMRDFDFSPQPDLFHDLFGHVPMLLNVGFADFLQQLGLAAQALAPANKLGRQQLWALYFFTAEFGLVLHEGKPKLYGAGLLSSAGEIHHCGDAGTPRLDFDLAAVLRTPVRDTRFQNQYFVLPDLTLLADCVAELSGLGVGEWRVAA